MGLPVRRLVPATSTSADLGPTLDREGLVATLAHPEASAADPDLPWLRANMVSSADGAGVGPDARSASLSGPPDRHVFALMRALADVVLVGAATARAERYGPAEARAEWADLREGRSAAPAIAVVSARLDVDVEAPLYSAPSRDTIVLTCAAAPARVRDALSERVDVVVAGEDRVDLRSAVRALAERGHRRVLCEGGPGLLAQVVAADLLDELCLTVSPLLTAGPARRILDGPPLDPVTRLRLTRLLEEDGYLFAGYERG